MGYMFCGSLFATTLNKQINLNFHVRFFFEAFLQVVVIYEEMWFLKFHSDFGKRLLIVE